MTSSSSFEQTKPCLWRESYPLSRLTRSLLSYLVSGESNGSHSCIIIHEWCGLLVSTSQSQVMLVVRVIVSVILRARAQGKTITVVSIVTQIVATASSLLNYPYSTTTYASSHFDSVICFCFETARQNSPEDSNAKIVLSLVMLLTIELPYEPWKRFNDGARDIATWMTRIIRWVFSLNEYVVLFCRSGSTTILADVVVVDNKILLRRMQSIARMLCQDESYRGMRLFLAYVCRDWRCLLATRVKPTNNGTNHERETCVCHWWWLSAFSQISSTHDILVLSLSDSVLRRQRHLFKKMRTAKICVPLVMRELPIVYSRSIYRSFYQERFNGQVREVATWIMRRIIQCVIFLAAFPVLFGEAFLPRWQDCDQLRRRDEN